MTALSFNEALFNKYRADQARDARGRWTADGGGGSSGGSSQRREVPKELVRAERLASQLKGTTNPAKQASLGHRLVAVVKEVAASAKEWATGGISYYWPWWYRALTVAADLAIVSMIAQAATAVAGPVAGWAAAGISAAHMIYATYQSRQRRAARQGREKADGTSW